MSESISFKPEDLPLGALVPVLRAASGNRARVVRAYRVSADRVAVDVDPNVELRFHPDEDVKAWPAGPEDLHLHLLSVHSLGNALSLSPAEAEAAHTHEHEGPGTIRNHNPADLSWDPEKARRVTAEVMADDWITPWKEGD